MSGFVVALTGGIGCGKTAVSDGFAGLGVDVVDTDLIAHRLTAANGVAMPAILDAFGAAARGPDGALDRAYMRQKVFADPGERARLEGILHPLIRAESIAAVAAAKSDYAMLVVPLLVESGKFRERADRILVVDCAVDLQQRRVMARSGLSAEDAQAIINAQSTREARLAIADDVIDNSGSRDFLAAQIHQLHRRYIDLAMQVKIRH
jgi:dephospho-CoA kinase